MGNDGMLPYSTVSHQNRCYSLPLLVVVILVRLRAQRRKWFSAAFVSSPTPLVLARSDASGFVLAVALRCSCVALHCGAGWREVDFFLLPFSCSALVFGTATVRYKRETVRECIRPEGTL
jgi:hypothetical protein